MIPDFLAHALAPERWPVFALITARLTGLMMLAPLWSMSALPRAARAAITVILAVLLLPLAPSNAVPDQTAELPLTVAVELAIGLAIGLVGAVLVQGMALAGEAIAVQMGLALGPLLSPGSDAQDTGIAQLQVTLAVLIYVSAGGHLMMLRGLADSLQTIPPGSAADLAAGGRSATELAATLFSTALRAAGPVMVSLLLSNAALALLSRAVPQLNAMMVSLPLSIGIGLVVLGAALPVVAGAMERWTSSIPSVVESAVQSFVPAEPR